MGYCMIFCCQIKGVFFVSQVTASFDETTTLEDVDKLFKVFAGGKSVRSTFFFSPNDVCCINYIV